MIIGAMVRHDHLQTEQPGEWREQTGADGMDMDQPGAALAGGKDREQGRHHRFEILRARAGDADNLDPAMPAHRLGQIGCAAEHHRTVIGPDRSLIRGSSSSQ